MDLGSKRFVSRQNFRNTTNAYTGARFDTPLADGALTAFWVMPQVRLPDDRAAIEDNRIAWDRESSNLQFAGLFWTRDLGQRRSLDLYVYGLTESDDADQQTRNRRLATPGVRWRHSPAAGAWDVEVEAAAQVGAQSSDFIHQKLRQNLGLWQIMRQDTEVHKRRRIPPGRRSVTGQMPSRYPSGPLLYESKLERDFLMSLEVDGHIRDVVTQPMTISLTVDGQARTYTPDIMAVWQTRSPWPHVT
ncbi:hypothetical protein LTR94_020171 [Friedmanniomyces endolithicus]|nr:hypothetical protein LTR94_020171 [Friedmanniomyces endolithicus]